MRLPTAGMLQSAGITLRPFGRHDAKVSALGFGGHHLGEAEDEKTAVQLVREAIEGGVTFFDNCWEYHRGKSEVWMGKALAGQRGKVFLMTKACTHGRDADLALRMLEESLTRLQTDHLDLWQGHGKGFGNDPQRPSSGQTDLPRLWSAPRKTARFVLLDSPAIRIQRFIL